MMTLDDAVDLVVYAFRNGKSGDLYVQKAPAATIGTLAEAVRRLFQINSRVTIIGTRHGEKLYETLLTREENARAEDLGEYYRVPADNRDLNYELYFSKGSEKLGTTEDYNSHNTKRLNLEEMVALLKELPELQNVVARRSGLNA